jgi:hypothetical protein
MIWHWYVARRNELFIDMDRYEQSINHMRRRLMGAIECGVLDISSVFTYPSIKQNHKHIIITLTHGIKPMERYAWEMLFHGDIYRAAANIMRESNRVPAPDILISNKILHRSHDDFCVCSEKHSMKIMDLCPAAIRLRGPYRTATYFGKPSKLPCTLL